MRYTTIIITLLCFPLEAFASELAYGARLWQGARHNPVGLATRLEANATWTYASSDNILLGDQKLTVAARVGGPAIVMGGAELRWEPLQILEVRLGYHRVGWFQLSRGRGVGASFTEFPSDFGTDALKANGDNERTTYGDLIQAIFVPKLKFGPFIAFSQIEMSFWGFPEGDYWYESNQDTIVEGGRGLVVDTLTLLGYLLTDPSQEDMWIIAAAYGAMLNPLFEESRERIGAGLVWRAKEPTWFSSAPTLQIIAGWNLNDPNREGTFFAMGALQLDWTL